MAAIFLHVNTFISIQPRLVQQPVVSHNRLNSSAPLCALPGRWRTLSKPPQQAAWQWGQADRRPLQVAAEEALSCLHNAHLPQSGQRNLRRNCAGARRVRCWCMGKTAPEMDPPAAPKHSVKKAAAWPVVLCQLYSRVPLLDRYVVAELLQPLLLGVAAISFLAVSIGASHEVAIILGGRGSVLQRGLKGVAVVALRTPFYVGLALPMASLLAPLLGFGRLGADHEIIALRACGVSNRRLVSVAALVFSAVTAAHFLFAEAFTPLAQRRAADLILHTRHAATVPVLMTSAKSASSKSKAHSAGNRWQPVIYREYRRSPSGSEKLSRLFQAAQFDGTAMLNVTMLEMGQEAVEGSGSDSSAVMASAGFGETAPSSRLAPAPHGPAAALRTAVVTRRPEKIVVAESAIWDESAQAWVMTAGTEYILQSLPPTTSAAPLASSVTPTGVQGANRPDSETGELAWGGVPQLGQAAAGSASAGCRLKEISPFQRRAFPGLKRVPLELAEAESGGSLDDMNLPQILSLQRLLAASRNSKGVLKITVKLHQRLALPFACAIFGVLGSLLSLRLPKNQKQVGFAFVFLTVFVYYALSVTGALLAQLGLVHPVAGAWLPNLAGAFAAALMILTSP